MVLGQGNNFTNLLSPGYGDVFAGPVEILVIIGSGQTDYRFGKGTDHLQLSPLAVLHLVDHKHRRSAGGPSTNDLLGKECSGRRAHSFVVIVRGLCIPLGANKAAPPAENPPGKAVNR